MVKKRFEAEIPDGTRLDRSRDTAGAFRATIRDDGNHLVGQVELFEVDDDDDLDDDVEVSLDDIAALGVGAALAGLGLVGLTVAAVAASGAFHDRKEARRQREWQRAEAQRVTPQDGVVHAPVSAPAGWYEAGDGRQRWWDGQKWTEHFKADPHRTPAPPGWYDDGAGNLRWWDGRVWTAHLQGSEPPPSSRSPRSISARSSNTTSSDLEMASEATGISMSSLEWKERVRAMLLARAFSEEQWRLLSHARIEDGDFALLEWQTELRKLTPKEFSDIIAYMLDMQSSSERSPVEQVRLIEAQRHESQILGMGGLSQAVGESARERVNARAGTRVSKAAGWYNDDSGRPRWWDGARWADY